MFALKCIKSLLICLSAAVLGSSPLFAASSADYLNVDSLKFTRNIDLYSDAVASTKYSTTVKTNGPSSETPDRKNYGDGARAILVENQEQLDQLTDYLEFASDHTLPLDTLDLLDFGEEIAFGQVSVDPIVVPTGGFALVIVFFVLVIVGAIIIEFSDPYNDALSAQREIHRLNDAIDEIVQNGSEFGQVMVDEAEEAIEILADFIERLFAENPNSFENPRPGS